MMHIISIDNTSHNTVFRLRAKNGEATENLSGITHDEMGPITAWLGLNGNKLLVDAFEVAMINAGLIRIVPQDRHGAVIHKCEAISVRHQVHGARILWQSKMACTTCEGTGRVESLNEADEEVTCWNCGGDGQEDGEQFWTDAEGVFEERDDPRDYYGPTPLPTKKDEFSILMATHSPPLHPHWSEAAEWRHDRWDPMCTAPSRGSVIVEVRGKTADGSIIDRMHYAVGGGDEQPPFEGWFAPYSSGRGYYQVSPVAWQPLRATYDQKEVKHG
jgi:hypothetical protein